MPKLGTALRPIRSASENALQQLSEVSFKRGAKRRKPKIVWSRGANQRGVFFVRLEAPRRAKGRRVPSHTSEERRRRQAKKGETGKGAFSHTRGAADDEANDPTCTAANSKMLDDGKHQCGTGQAT